jgi:hypothetical protein
MKKMNVLHGREEEKQEASLHRSRGKLQRCFVVCQRLAICTRII